MTRQSNIKGAPPPPQMKEKPDAAGRMRPTYAPLCCKVGIHVIHPGTGLWACSECAVYGPLRERGNRK